MRSRRRQYWSPGVFEKLATSDTHVADHRRDTTSRATTLRRLRAAALCNPHFIAKCTTAATPVATVAAKMTTAPARKPALAADTLAAELGTRALSATTPSALDMVTTGTEEGCPASFDTMVCPTLRAQVPQQSVPQPAVTDSTCTRLGHTACCGVAAAAASRGAMYSRMGAALGDTIADARDALYPSAAAALPRPPMPLGTTGRAPDYRTAQLDAWTGVQRRTATAHSLFRTSSLDGTTAASSHARRSACAPAPTAPPADPLREIARVPRRPLQPAARSASPERKLASPQIRSRSPGARRLLKSRNAGGARSNLGRAAPTARAGRTLRAALVSEKLADASGDRARCRRANAALHKRMSRLWTHIEAAKPGLRCPEHAQQRFDPYAPEWERWRSLFLVPDKAFQTTHRPVRR